ncbi:MAG: alpha/beta hydrolase [bacterium]|nr:alpha/beta hydrolase [bacterium]
MDGARAREAFREALARLDRLRARDDGEVAEHSRTRAYVHAEPARRVTLFLHGLTSAPPQFAELAEGLHRRGHNVLVPRMPRHGLRDRMTDALADLRAAELREAAAEATAIARGLGARLTVAGFSMGGTLAAWLGQRCAEIDHAVSIAPFLGFAALPPAMGPACGLALRALPNRFMWWDPRLRERSAQTEHGYPRFASRALGAVLEIAAQTQGLAQREPPAARRLTLVLNAHETSVNNAAAHRLGARWLERAPERASIVVWRHLPWSHDIIEPAVSGSYAPLVNPLIVELIDDAAP